MSYAVQHKPNGLPEAFIIGEEFIAGDECALVLGDNIFWSSGFSDMLEKSATLRRGAEIYAHLVKDPQRFGVVALDCNQQACELEEKPKNPRSNWAVTGLYFYDSKVCQYAKTLRPSKRGGLEITDLNKSYLIENRLNVNLLDRGFAWLDAGTHDGLLDASNFVATIQRRQEFMIACLEENAFNNGWISKADLVDAIDIYQQTEYGNYLKTLILQ